MKESVIVESKTLRDDLCKEEYFGVLEKVGDLEPFENNTYITKENLVSFFQVKVGTLDSTITRYKKELREDGYKVLQKKDFENMHHACFDEEIPNRGIAVFTKRSVLRLAMLLRESVVAKMIRTYLLDLLDGQKPQQNTQDQLSQMAEQIVSQALMVRAVVNEINFTKAGVNVLKENFRKHENRITNLESMYKTNLSDEYISPEEVKMLQSKVRNSSVTPVKVWKKFNSHFQISRYRQLPHKEEIVCKVFVFPRACVKPISLHESYPSL